MELLIMTVIGGMLGLAVPLVLFAFVYPRLMFWFDDRAFRSRLEVRSRQRKAERHQWFADYDRRSAELNQARLR